MSKNFKVNCYFGQFILKCTNYELAECDSVIQFFSFRVRPILINYCIIVLYQLIDSYYWTGPGWSPDRNGWIALDSENG